MHLIHSTKVNHELSDPKEIVSSYDTTLFLWHDTTGNLMDIVVMHVNDFIFSENDTFQRNVISELKRIFKVGTHENGTFKFLGSICFIYIANRHEEKKVLKKKMMLILRRQI